jgi:hypothetical protein
MDATTRVLLEAIHDALDLDPRSYPTFQDYLEDRRDRGSWVLAAVTVALDPDRPRSTRFTGAAAALAEHAPPGEHNRPRQHRPIPIPESADVPPKLRKQHEVVINPPRGPEESGWCAECGQECGHRGHPHAQGDHAETYCQRCGETLPRVT